MNGQQDVKDRKRDGKYDRDRSDRDRFYRDHDMDNYDRARYYRDYGSQHFHDVRDRRDRDYRSSKHWTPDKHYERSNSSRTTSTWISMRPPPYGLEPYRIPSYHEGFRDRHETVGGVRAVSQILIALLVSRLFFLVIYIYIYISF